MLFDVELSFRGTPKTIRYDLNAENPNEDTIISFLRHGRFYEPDAASIFMRVLEEGDTVIDVGANIGYFTALAGAAVGDNGTVIAFEPDTNNCIKLNKNLALSKVFNVDLIEQPVSDKPGPITFFINQDNSGGNALWDPGKFPGNDRSQDAPCPQEMTATTLSEVMAERDTSRLKLIKIDTEGAEQTVLKGAEDLLRGAKVPFIITELHEFGLHEMGHSQQSLRTFMKDLGYDTFALDKDGSMPHLVPLNTNLTSDFFINILFSTPEHVGKVWTEFKPKPVC